MPRLWNETIETHRHAVREAAIDSTLTLVAKHGLRSVTMSQIAEDTGIGRATLYKYFPDVEAILRAWHEREIKRHLDQLATARDAARDPAHRLRGVLETYAEIAHTSRGHRDSALASLLHRDRHVVRAQHEVAALMRDVLSDASVAGLVRADVPSDELAAYCLHALAAAAAAPSRAAVARLVDLTLAGLRQPNGR